MIGNTKTIKANSKIDFFAIGFSYWPGRAPPFYLETRPNFHTLKEGKELRRSKLFGSTAVWQIGREAHDLDSDFFQ